MNLQKIIQEFLQSASVIVLEYIITLDTAKTYDEFVEVKNQMSNDTFLKQFVPNIFNICKDVPVYGYYLKKIYVPDYQNDIILYDVNDLDICNKELIENMQKVMYYTSEQTKIYIAYKIDSNFTNVSLKILNPFLAVFSSASVVKNKTKILYCVSFKK